MNIGKLEILHRLRRNVFGLPGQMTWNGIWLMVFLAAFAFYFIVAPKCYDDYLFLWYIWPWFEQQGLLTPEWGGDVWNYGIPWDLILDTWCDSFETDNVRLPNLIVPFILLCPRWVGGLILTVLFAWSVILAFRLAGVDWRRSRLVPMAVLLWTYFLPWQDRFASIDFSLNYIMPAWLVLLLYDYLQKNRGRGGWRVPVWSSLLGLLIGWSHEEVGLSACCGLIVLMVADREWRCRSALYACVMMLMTVTASLITPGMMNRIAESGNSIPGLSSLLRFYYLWQKNLVNFVLVCGLLTVSVMRFNMRQVISNPLIVFLFVSSTVNAGCMLILTLDGRVFYYSEFVSVIILMQLIRINFSGTNIKKTGWLHFVNAVLVLVAFYRLLVFDCFAVMMRRNSIPAMEEFAKNPAGGFFGELPDRNWLPLWMGPGVDDYVNISFYYYVDILRQEPRENRAQAYTYSNITRAAVPHALEYITPESGMEMPGDHRIRIVDGYMFMKEEDADAEETAFSRIKVEIDYGSGRFTDMGEAYRFRSKGDGRYYVWLVPLYKGWYVSHFKPIIYIHFKENLDST